MLRGNDDRRRSRRGNLATLGLVFGLVFAVAVTAATVSAENAAPGQAARQLRSLEDAHRTKSFWANTAKPERGSRVAVHARAFRSLTLATNHLKSVLALAPREQTVAARTNPLVVRLPAPNGSFRSFALQESAVMAPGLAKAPSRDQDVHRARDHRSDSDDPRRSDSAWLPGFGPFGARHLVHRSVLPRPRPRRLRELLRPGCEKHERRVVEHDSRSADLSLDEAAHESTGDQLRTYRLALITDPGYSTYHRRPAVRDRSQGRAREPSDADLRGRPHDPPATDREQRSPQPQRLWRRRSPPTGPAAPRGCFTQGQVTGLLEHDARAATSIGQIMERRLRHRPPRSWVNPAAALPASAWSAARTRPVAAPGVTTPVGDYLRRRLRRPRDGPPVRRQPHVQRQPAQLRRRQPNAADLRRAGQRPVGHGLCRHLPDGRRAAAQRRLLLAAQPAGDHVVRLLESDRRSTRCRRSRFATSAGGNEVQVVTFGPGYEAGRRHRPPERPGITQPPNSTSRGGAEENGTTVTIATEVASLPPGR